MATTGRRNYVVFVMDGKVAFTGTQKAYDSWKYWHVPGQDSLGVPLKEIGKHGMAWEYFTYKRDMEAYVANFPNVRPSDESIQVLLAGSLVAALAS